MHMRCRLLRHTPYNPFQLSLVFPGSVLSPSRNFIRTSIVTEVNLDEELCHTHTGGMQTDLIWQNR
ncbi:hypothetical protein AU176_09445 [Salmonella enterica]|nr:hypothetical protein [Salmonella enterica]